MTDYFHIRITCKAIAPYRVGRTEAERNLTLESLEQRFLMAYRRARPLVLNGRPIATDNIERIRIYKSEEFVVSLNNVPDSTVEVTGELIVGAPGWELEEEKGMVSLQNHQPSVDAKEVFVVHGRNDGARKALFDFLRAIGLKPVEWSEAVRATGKASPYIGEILDAAFSRAHAVVVLFTPDDEARLREQFRIDSDLLHETQLTGQARPNVLFEAGMAMARSQDRTVLVELGDLRPFSDVAGRHAIRLDNSSQRRQDLAQRLEAAGCPVNLQGTDWHTAGDFEAALVLLTQGLSEPMAVEEQPSNNAAYPQLSDDAKELLVAATKSSAREILKAAASGGLTIQANGKSFTERGNAKSEARWEQALEDLLDYGLVTDPRGKGQVFEVTHKGFQVADSLEASQ